MFEVILVPLDGSQRAEKILPVIQELAGCIHAQVVLVQVIEPVLMPYDPQGYLPELDAERTEQRRQEAAEYLAKTADNLRENGLNVMTRVEEGPVVESILDICTEEKPKLIALASHGRTGLARVFYGSVADGILHQCTCPLLVIRSV
jgi:nucleotide-binding universal stress UspA family protein